MIVEYPDGDSSKTRFRFSKKKDDTMLDTLDRQDLNSHYDMI